MVKRDLSSDLMVSTVGVVCEQFWHNNPGGVAYASRMTLKALASSQRYDLVGYGASHRDHRSPIPTHHSKLSRKVMYELWLRGLYRGMDRALPDANVIWAPGMVAPPSDRPVVVTVHDLDFASNPQRLSRRGRYFFPRAWRAAKRSAAAIVCPSEAVANDAKLHGARPDIVHVVPWGVDVDNANYSESANLEAQLPDDYVLWVGTNEPRKNLGRILKAVESVDGVNLVMVGPSGWGTQEDPMKYPGLSGRVFHLGELSHQELASVYKRALALVFCSLHEGFGLPILEAMAHRIPVITSNLGAMAEVAGDSGLLVDPTDVSAISQAIATMVKSPAKQAAYAQRGFDRSKEFTWGRAAAGYAAVFEEVVN